MKNFAHDTLLRLNSSISRKWYRFQWRNLTNSYRALIRLLRQKELYENSTNAVLFLSAKIFRRKLLPRSTTRESLLTARFSSRLAFSPVISAKSRLNRSCLQSSRDASSSCDYAMRLRGTDFASEDARKIDMRRNESKRLSFISAQETCVDRTRDR